MERGERMFLLGVAFLSSVDLRARAVGPLRPRHLHRRRPLREGLERRLGPRRASSPAASRPGARAGSTRAGGPGARGASRPAAAPGPHPTTTGAPVGRWRARRQEALSSRSGRTLRERRAASSGGTPTVPRARRRIPAAARLILIAAHWARRRPRRPRARALDVAGVTPSRYLTYRGLGAAMGHMPEPLAQGVARGVARFMALRGGPALAMNERHMRRVLAQRVRGRRRARSGARCGAGAGAPSTPTRGTGPTAPVCPYERRGGRAGPLAPRAGRGASAGRPSRSAAASSWRCRTSAAGSGAATGWRSRACR